MALLAFNMTIAPVTLAAGNPARVLPASLLAGTRGEAVNVTSELEGLAAGGYILLEAQRVATTVEFEWTDEPEYATGALTPDDPSTAAGDLEALLASDAAGEGASLIALEAGSMALTVQDAIDDLEAAESELVDKTGMGSIACAGLNVSVADFGDGDLVEIGGDAFEALAAGDVPCEIGATVPDTTTNLVAALTPGAVQPADATTFVFGGVTFEWDDGGGVVPGNTAILLGANIAASLVAMKIAIDADVAVVNPTDLDFPTICGVVVEFHTLGNIPFLVDVGGIDATLANLVTAINDHGTEDVAAYQFPGVVGNLFIQAADAPGGIPVVGIPASVVLPAPTVGGATIALWDADDLDETGFPEPTHQAEGICVVGVAKAASILAGAPTVIAALPFLPTVNTILTFSVETTAGVPVAVTGSCTVPPGLAFVAYQAAGLINPVASDVIKWSVKSVLP